MPARALAALLLACTPGLAAPVASTGQASTGQASTRQASTEPATTGRDVAEEPVVGVDCAALGGGTALSFAELDDLLLARHGRAREGREATLHLLKTGVLAVLEREQGLAIPESELLARRDEIERQVQLSGEATSLEAYLAAEGVDLARFLHLLRLGLVQETLARRALGIPPDDPITAEQQEVWLEGVLGERGLTDGTWPWRDGPVARCGEVTVSRQRLALELRQTLDPQSVRDACYQLLLARRLRARVPDLSAETVAEALDLDIERRRREAATNERFGGATFEQLLAAKGMDLASLRTDPSVRISALSRLYVERRFDADALRNVYLTERETFDGRFGEALSVDLVLLRAARFENDLVPRTFEEAEAELAELAADVGGRDDFRRLARTRSEDKGSAARDGSLGWVARQAPEVPPSIRLAVFDALDSKRLDPGGAADDRRRLLGPLRTAEGCVLLWVAERRPPPTWEVMSAHVATELRRRLVEEVLSPEETVTFVDLEKARGAR